METIEYAGRRYTLIDIPAALLLMFRVYEGVRTMTDLPEWEQVAALLETGDNLIARLHLSDDIVETQGYFIVRQAGEVSFRVWQQPANQKPREMYEVEVTLAKEFEVTTAVDRLRKLNLLLDV